MTTTATEDISSLVDLPLWTEAAKNITWSVPPRAVLEKKNDGSPNPYVW